MQQTDLVRCGGPRFHQSGGGGIVGMTCNITLNTPGDSCSIGNECRQHIPPFYLTFGLVVIYDESDYLIYA